MSRLSPRVSFARRIANGDAAMRLYAILDAESCQRRGLDVFVVAEAWKQADVAVVQYRDKVSSRDVVRERAAVLRQVFPEAAGTFLLLNDFCDLAASCGLDGVHVGQSDTSVAEARRVLGPQAVIGVSTHTPDQAAQAEGTDCDYVAIGPVFPTLTKSDAEPAVGTCGVLAARAQVRKPLVAIGGIGPQNLLRVRSVGADMIALISGLLGPSTAPAGTRPEELSATLTQDAQDFLLRLK